MPIRKSFLYGLLLAPVVATAGCVSGGAFVGILGGPRGEVIHAYVWNVYPNRREIYLRDRDGARLRVGFDGRTRIFFQGRAYRPGELARGDYITLHVQRERGDRYYANRIDVLRGRAGEDRQERGRGDRDGRRSRGHGDRHGHDLAVSP